MFALFTYNSRTRKYQRVAQSTNIAYLGRLAVSRYSSCRWMIRPLGGTKYVRSMV